MAVALDDGRAGHHQRLAVAGEDAAFDEGARLERAGCGQVGIHGAGARLRIHARRHRTHAAGDRLAGIGQGDGVADGHVGQLRFGQFGAPFQAAVADQAQQLAAGRDDLAGLDQPLGDHAIGGRTQLGEIALQPGRVQRGARGRQPNWIFGRSRMSTLRTAVSVTSDWPTGTAMVRTGVSS